MRYFGPVDGLSTHPPKMTHDASIKNKRAIDIVDDGVPSRGHRLGVYDVNYHKVGISTGYHKTFGYVCCMTFAHTYVPDPESCFPRLTNGPVIVRGSSKVRGKPVETQWKSLGICAGCGEDIRGGSVVDGPNGRKWHKDCFYCVVCQGALTGQKYFFQDSKLYCDRCHTDEFAETCKGCGEKIKGRMMKAAGHFWHEQCFKCVTCRKQITGGKFQTVEGGARCVKCVQAEQQAQFQAQMGGPSNAKNAAASSAKKASVMITSRSKQTHFFFSVHTDSCLSSVSNFSSTRQCILLSPWGGNRPRARTTGMEVGNKRRKKKRH